MHPHATDSDSESSATAYSNTSSPTTVRKIQFDDTPVITKLPTFPKAASFLSSPIESLFQIIKIACLNVFAKIETGSLTVVDATNKDKEEVYHFGRKDDATRSTIRILRSAFWPRLMIYSALGFSESFMANEVEVEGLTNLIIIFIRNRENLAAMELLPFGLNSIFNSIIHSKIPNTIYNSLLNISAHYDLGNEMFESFLDPTMMYSCPIWEIGNEGESLESAQYRKIHRILELAKIRRGDSVLEVGTGWGALSIEAVRKYDCTVVTLTLSKEQKALAEARIAKAGLSDKITVLLTDYRNLDPAHHQYDRIVTVEMLEAVGPEFMPVFFAQAEKLLKKNGILSLQVITMVDSRYIAYCKEIDFIQKYIFPGGHCPSVTSLTDAIYKGSKGKLVIDEMDNIGPHYAKALRLWREAFLENFDRIRDVTGLHHVYTQEFKRRWEYYFSYCEAGFATRALGDVQMRLTKECNEELVAGIPL
ncbi:hypothetical protein HK100_006386 [Physocladia obscura]|uniref:Cyclopropane-fatty-acyl-phospholipid synthase n=1 Tax=Physocladia obscura TaxID=109957 RepID=A0AAD5SQI4_9FUNG|nr:hypothetical protein HK100_006386 [Physocladia obscura]